MVMVRSVDSGRILSYLNCRDHLCILHMPPTLRRAAGTREQNQNTQRIGTATPAPLFD
jgi:hypothetical protein